MPLAVKIMALNAIILIFFLLRSEKGKAGCYLRRR
jgi:hypothetical protein